MKIASAVLNEFTTVGESGGITEYRLNANGLRVLVMPLPGPPVSAFMVTYHVGSRNEVGGLTGATHFLEHLMFKGTARFNSKDGTSVFNVLQRVGARVNATTWLDRTNYYELLGDEHLPLAVEIEADRMRNALIDEDDVESERTVILNEMDRGENSSNMLLYRNLWSTAFQAHPYGHPTIGWRSDVENVTADGLRHFYDAYYWPKNATISVIGSTPPERALSLVQEHFGSIPAGPDHIDQQVTAEPPQQGERRVLVEQAGQLGAVMIAHKSPDALHADIDALNVLDTILSSGKGSRLYRRLTDNGLTAGVGATTSRHRDPGLVLALAFLAPDATHEQVEKEILDELQQIAEDGVTDGEVTRAKRQLRAQTAFGRDGAFAIAAQLNEMIAVGNWRLYTEFLDRIERVTAEDVQHVAGKYLRARTRTVGWYVPTSS